MTKYPCYSLETIVLKYINNRIYCCKITYCIDVVYCYKLSGHFPVIWLTVFNFQVSGSHAVGCDKHKMPRKYWHFITKSPKSDLKSWWEYIMWQWCNILSSGTLGNLTSHLCWAWLAGSGWGIHAEDYLLTDDTDRSHFYLLQHLLYIIIITSNHHTSTHRLTYSTTTSTPLYKTIKISKSKW